MSDLSDITGKTFENKSMPLAVSPPPEEDPPQSLVATLSIPVVIGSDVLSHRTSALLQKPITKSLWQQSGQFIIVVKCKQGTVLMFTNLRGDYWRPGEFV